MKIIYMKEWWTKIQINYKDSAEELIKILYNLGMANILMEYQMVIQDIWVKLVIMNIKSIKMEKQWESGNEKYDKFHIFLKYLNERHFIKKFI